MLIRLADAISEATGRIAAWGFFAIGLIVTYEVVMRYVFNAPTIWVDEISRVAQVWAAYLAMGYAMKHREMIVIDIAFRDHTTLMRRIAETFTLGVIMAVCAVTVWFGFDQWLSKTMMAERTDTFLGMPKWITLASVWVGFLILMVQALAELFRVWTVGVPESKAH
ncbi:TRAP transporter small permease [Rhodobacteraceae bacterium NNCM2]|nr:TRAP transporter small permease [Coraliihabitans acroporae]